VSVNLSKPSNADRLEGQGRLKLKKRSKGRASVRGVRKAKVLRRTSRSSKLESKLAKLIVIQPPKATQRPRDTKCFKTPLRQATPLQPPTRRTDMDLELKLSLTPTTTIKYRLVKHDPCQRD
jgi:hypothetical protein